MLESLSGDFTSKAFVEGKSVEGLNVITVLNVIKS